jgi:hypothetical protein
MAHCIEIAASRRDQLLNPHRYENASPRKMIYASSTLLSG